MYQLEQALVDDFITSVSQPWMSPWGPVETIVEFDYARGRTDIVALTDEGEIIAFEAKLSRWRDAAHQAYRNTCFAHRSYVLLPETVAAYALRHTEAFARLPVGICYLAEGRVVIAQEAPRIDPIQPWLSEQARERLGGRSSGD